MAKLKGDKNSWVGLQTQTLTLEDAKPIPNVTEAKLRAGPYGKPIMDPNHPDLGNSYDPRPPTQPARIYCRRA